ncbi:TonB-dependent siderophore receptor [Bradyrhizobium sp.]|uniref:TonB-dependent siderophore receptor n=1 Tax=Bradyrhizobium sp. TaxID=376 RepID=UPI002DDDAB15|nr:TonB-dependent siderophore receptor [Bradyrhizobium sp.]HEV2157572.1 TonB-dependent siderophore receptor [Bradyrhizobium sp.]
MKSDTPILETPQSVSVVSRDQLDARSVTTLVEGLQYVAGLAIQPGGKDPRFDNVFIRGFDNNGYGAYRDGLREVGDPNFFSLFRNEPYGFERIDVIKGPSSVMYGQGAPGGLVDVISKRPPEQAFGEIAGQFGNYDRFQGAFDFGGPATKDGTLLYRLTGVFRDSDAQIANFSNFVKDNRTYIAPAVTWKPTNYTTLTILADYTHDLTGNAFPLSMAHVSGGKITGVTALPLFLGDPSYNKFDQEQERIGYQFEHRFSNNLIFESKARYGHSELDYRYLTYNIASPVDTLTIFPRRAVRTLEQTDSLSTDNHLISKFSMGPLQHTVVSGVDYLTFNMTDRTYGGSAPSLSKINPVYDQTIAMPTTLSNPSVNQSIDQVGVYVQDQMKLQNWIFTLGGRYDSSEQNSYTLVTNKTTDAKDTAFSKRGAVSYVFDSGVAPYYSYSESFLPTPGTDFGGSPFKPTTAQQHEVGVKYQPSRTLLMTVALYDLTRQNSLTTDPSHLGSSVQLGEVNSRGVEFEVLAQIVPGLNLVATYTNMDVKVTETTVAADLGKVPTSVARQLASAYVDYTVQGGIWDGWGLGGGVRYTGPTFADTTNTIVNEGYVVFDAGLHYRQPKGVSLALNVKNIADRVTLACTTGGGCQYTSPRTITGTVSYRW